MLSKRNIIISICSLFFLGSNFPVHGQQSEYQTIGVANDLPVFYEKLAARQNYPLSWTHGRYSNFSTWRKKAKAQVMQCMFTPPPAVPFDAKIITEQDRGTYVARKIIFNITRDSRVLAFMLVPKSNGPHPAVLLLHSHDGIFDIGKEKVIEPWDEPVNKIQSAKDLINKSYGGKFIGDELAKRGYVCLAVDMLNWSDRGGAGAEGQQALASNLFNLGSSFAGLIVYEDLRAADFLAAQPEVDSNRIAAMGLSVGGFRTWHLAALSKHIAAGVAVCWMSTYKGLMVPENNQTKGQSSYTMVHPGLSQYLDYPDVASIACPKPMMFLSGNHDHLFPLPSINEAFKKLHYVWASQHAEKNLVTKLYDIDHEFSLLMQTDAFEWLGKKLLKNRKD